MACQGTLAQKGDSAPNAPEKMPQIPKEIIDQIAAANDIVDVIGTYFPLKRMGVLYKALCPFHQERTPSFTVNQQRQSFKCFGCGAGGSVFRFVMDYEHIDFIAAVRKLAERANIQVVEATMKPEDYARLDMRKRLLSFHAEVADSFHIQLMRSPAAAHARDYLKERGLNADVAKSWKIGYAPEGWDFIRNLAYAKGYRDEEIIASGLVSMKGGDAEDSRLDTRNPKSFYDRFRDRIMFPICNDNSEVIAFSGRILDSEKSPAKYVNSPETMLFTKGDVLFGLNKSKRALINQKAAIVCEGQMDLIMAFESGVQNVIASQGTAFTKQQAHILKRYVDEVILCFDSDAAGIKAAERSLPHLLGENLIIKIATMPPGEDPDSLIRKHGAEAFLAQINKASEFFDFQIDRQASRADFKTPAGKLAAARKLAELISLIPNNIVSNAAVSNAAIRLELPPQDVQKLLKRIPKTHERSEHSIDSPQIELTPNIKLLLYLALNDHPSRVWLQSRGWSNVLTEDVISKNLMAKVLEADLIPGDPASIGAFASTLSPAEEAAITFLVSDSFNHLVINDPKVITEDCWHELERRELLFQLQSLKSKQHNPALSLDEQSQLYTRISEVQKQLAALPPPHPPKVELR